MKSNEEVIKYLNELRKQQKISISELARKVDMSKSTVSQYFNGKLNSHLIERTTLHEF